MQNVEMSLESNQSESRRTRFKLHPSHRVAQLIAGFAPNKNALVTLRLDGQKITYELSNSDRLFQFTEPAGNLSCEPVELQIDAERIKKIYRLYKGTMAATYEDETLTLTQDSSAMRIAAQPVVSANVDDAMVDAAKFKAPSATLRAALDFCLPFAIDAQDEAPSGLRFYGNTLATGDGTLAVAVVEFTRGDVSLDFGLSQSAAECLSTVLAYMAGIVTVAVTKTFVEISDEKHRLHVPNEDTKLPPARGLLSRLPTASVRFDARQFAKQQMIHQNVLRPRRNDVGAMTLTYNNAEPRQIAVRTINRSVAGHQSTDNWSVQPDEGVDSWQVRVDLKAMTRIVPLVSGRPVCLGLLQGSHRGLWVSQDSDDLKGHVLLVERNN